MEQTTRYAGFWVRFFAMFIDFFIILIPSMIIQMFLPYVGGVICSIAYKPFFESSSLQATPGKAIMGLRVVSLTSEKVGFKQALIRYVSTYLSSALAGIGYLMAAFTEKNQSLHDKIADTVVVYSDPQEKNYLNIWTNQVQNVFGFAEEQKLENLQRLFQKGLITESEYNQKKEEILKRI